MPSGIFICLYYLVFTVLNMFAELQINKINKRYKQETLFAQMCACNMLCVCTARKVLVPSGYESLREVLIARNECYKKLNFQLNNLNVNRRIVGKHLQSSAVQLKAKKLDYITADKWILRGRNFIG